MYTWEGKRKRGGGDKQEGRKKRGKKGKRIGRLCFFPRVGSRMEMEEGEEKKGEGKERRRQ